MPRLFFGVIFTILLTGALPAQALFSDQTATALPPGNNFSGVAMGVADLNGDGIDDIVRLQQGREPEFLLQQSDGTFSAAIVDNDISRNYWGLCIGDADQDGTLDVAFGGFGTDLFKGYFENDTLHYGAAFMPPTEFQQGANFVDMDNDGDLDHFACDDVALSVPSRNDGAGNFVEDYGLINPVSTVPSDNSGNYASIWTDYDDDGDVDLYLSKCRQGVANPDDGRRLNQLFRNDGAAGFVDVAEAAGLLPRAQTWSTDFADVDNDGDLDAFIFNHDAPSLMMLNDGQGFFTDGSAAWGIPSSFSSLGIQAIFEDFDNDGWVDLLLTFTGGFSKIYHNNRNGSFNLIQEADLTEDVVQQFFQSATTGDLNNDGYIDMYIGHASGYNGPSGTPDALLINNGGANNHLKVNLRGTMSNLNGIGAKIKIYGSWGIQTREIRSGEGYGISNSLTGHFGLGADTEVTRLVVQWPSGLVEETLNVAANSNLTITEGSLTATLPLTWKSLTATPVDNKFVELNWQTEQEVATSHFVVQRQTGPSWLTIAEVAATGESGINHYRTLDETAAVGNNVYRVQQVDRAGTATFSPLATATLQPSALSIFPNPATNRVVVRHTFPEQTSISLETVTGRVLLTTTNTKINLSEFPVGVYLVRVKDEVKRLIVR